jgi:DUF438 domain-containing protein
MTDGQSKTNPERLEKLKAIIRGIHAGEDPADLRLQFADLIRGVDGSEISRMEQQLIEEGMPSEDIKRLCDVHVQVFRESLDEQARPNAKPGHPVHTFRAENVLLGEAAERLKCALDDLGSPPDATRFADRKNELAELASTLRAIEFHYLRKENQLFPVLERYGVTGPTQVMWAIHDDVRRLLKEFTAAVDAEDLETAAARGPELAQTLLEMIYKEENILFPMAMETLSEADWVEIRAGEDELGYAVVTPGREWKPAATPAAGEADERAEPRGGPRGMLPLDTGALTPEQVNLLLTHLPLDVTFVDENDEVRFYSATPERLFPRSPGIIGRRVQNCHPPDSVDVVERIIGAFRSGERDSAEFWLRLGDKMAHIRYFAMRDGSGAYRGTLEVSQDIAPIQEIEGERRLLEWGD